MAPEEFWAENRPSASWILPPSKKSTNLGVLHELRSKRDLDEAPGAYKDINQVISNQTDLVNIKVSLKPLAMIKG